MPLEILGKLVLSHCLISLAFLILINNQNSSSHVEETGTSKCYSQHLGLSNKCTVHCPENRSMIRKVDGKKGGGINVPVSLELLLAPGEAKKLTTEIKALGIWCEVIPGK